MKLQDLKELLTLDLPAHLAAAVENEINNFETETQKENRQLTEKILVFIEAEYAVTVVGIARKFDIPIQKAATLARRLEAENKIYRRRAFGHTYLCIVEAED